MHSNEVKEIFHKNLSTILLEYAQLDAAIMNDVIYIQNCLAAIVNAENRLKIENPKKRTNVWVINEKQMTFLINKYGINNEDIEIASGTKKYDGIGSVPPLGAIAVDFGFIPEGIRGNISQIKASISIIEKVCQAREVEPTDKPAAKEEIERFVRKKIYHGTKKLAYNKFKIDDEVIPMPSASAQAADHMATIFKRSMEAHPPLAEIGMIQESLDSLEALGLVFLYFVQKDLKNHGELGEKISADVEEIIYYQELSYISRRGKFDLNSLPIKIHEGAVILCAILEEEKVFDEVEYNSVPYSDKYTGYMGQENEFTDQLRKNGILNVNKYRDILNETKYKDLLNLCDQRVDQIMQINYVPMKRAGEDFLDKRYWHQHVKDDIEGRFTKIISDEKSAKNCGDKECSVPDFS